jgi:hypothetical protein
MDTKRIMDMIFCHYNTAFPLKTVCRGETKMDHPRNTSFLCKDEIVKNCNLSRELLDYIKRYQIIYMGVIKKAKRLANDNYVLRAKIKCKR